MPLPGRTATRAGKFAAAGRGTLLLDDIDALPVSLQTKLLRAVDERVFELVGTNNAVPVECPNYRCQQPAAGPRGGRGRSVPTCSIG